MLRARAASGWQNYSLFLRPDGMLVGYFETPSVEAARAGMAATEVNPRWQPEMAEYSWSRAMPGPTQGSCS
jgi:L-rhamnose mutarotase